MANKLPRARTIISTLKDNTADLPLSNPLKRFIKHVMGILFNRKHYIKPAMHHRTAKLEKLLLQFERRSAAKTPKNCNAPEAPRKDKSRPPA